MKTSLVFLMAIIFAIMFAGCNNKKNENTEWLTTPESTLVEADDIYPATTFFLEGTFFLDGEEGGETSPRIHYGFNQNSDFYVSLVLLTSSSIEGASNSTGIPIDLAVKVRDIVQKNSKKENFYFWTDDDGWVWIGYYSGSVEENQPLNSALLLLEEIQKETNWYVTKDKWQARE